MSLAHTYAAALMGIDCFLVDVEVSIYGKAKEDQPPLMNVGGLPDTAVRESRDRVKSALLTSGFTLDRSNILINLAPADIRKEGSAFDLPIALALIAAQGEIDPEILSQSLILGELALNGDVRAIKGAIAIADAVSQNGKMMQMIVPKVNAQEASISARDMKVYGVCNLLEAVHFLQGKIQLEPTQVDVSKYLEQQLDDGLDFADVKGQSRARRGLEIAAAGGHNLLMIGPPGTGKSMLAKRFSSILPRMTLQEALETTKIHSSCGKLPIDEPIVWHRPFRDPHHTASDVGLIGGNNIPTPGEISLAHNGVLFLDELPEFKRNVLEVLRQPLENGKISVTRAAGCCTFPARFILLAAMNPCSCGYYGSHQRECRCGSSKIQRYRERLSGPLLDRIDIHVEVASLTENELVNAPTGDSSAMIRQRVMQARCLQQTRFANTNIFCNAQMQSRDIRIYCQLNKQAEARIRFAIREFQLSARAYDRILRVARTIADLANEKELSEMHVFEAIQYRQLDKQLW